MSVYVDQVRIPVAPPSMPRCFRAGACHMWADTLDELHAFAGRIGMRRGWFQPHNRLPHYDLTPSRRTKALKAGAIELSVREYWRRIEPRSAHAPEPHEDGA